MYCPSQNSAPSSVSQVAWHSPCTEVVQSTKPPAWQSTWQPMLASASHEPLQLASHLASHSALGGTAWQSASQLAEQVAWQAAMHSESPLEHDALQLPSQGPWQEAWQSNEPGLALHSPSQEAVQLPVHSTLASAVHCPAHSSCSSAAQAA